MTQSHISWVAGQFRDEPGSCWPGYRPPLYRPEMGPAHPDGGGQKGMHLLKCAAVSLIVIAGMAALYAVSWAILKYDIPDPNYRSYGYALPFSDAVIGSSAYWTSQAVADMTLKANANHPGLRARDYFYRRGVAAWFYPAERIDMFVNGIETVRPK